MKCVETATLSTMNSDTKISITLPTYNRADLLPNAISSILSQSYPHWELLVWDDGSTDKTKAVIQSFTDDRIRYFCDDNHGKPYALNQAISKATGQYLAFLDDDDQWLPSKLEKQINTLLKYTQVDLIFGNFNNSDKETQISDVGFSQNTRGLEALRTKKLDENCFLILEGWLNGISASNFIAFDTVIMKKEVIHKLGPFNEDLRISEDFEYWWRFGLAGLTAAYTKDILMKRIKIPGSLSGRSITGIENQLKMLDSCAKQSKAYGHPDTATLLRPMYRNAWQNKILFYGQAGDKKNAWRSFLRSLDYGFRLGSAKILFKALV